MKIGFVGLGAMGRPMVRHLLNAGHEVSVWARRPEALADSVAAGAQACDSPEQLAARSETVCSNVTGSADVEALARRFRNALPADGLHIDFSTIAPSAARRIAADYAADGRHFVDAPVSGGGTGAENATLSIMWGGASALAERVLPLFRCLGKTIVHVGEAGAGQVAKACNQMVMVAAIEACAEASALARAAGVDVARVQQAMLGGSAGSRVLEVFGARMAARNYTAGVEARLHHKDYALLMDEACRLGVPLPVSAAVWQQLNALMAHGWGHRDTAILARLIDVNPGEQS